MNRKTEQAIKLLQQNLSIIHFCIIQLNWSYEIHEICDYVQCTAFLDSDKRLSIAQTSDRRIPNFQSVEQSITSFDIFKSDFLDF